MSSQSSSPPPPPHILPLNYDDSECDPITPDSRSAQELYRRIHHGMNPSSSVSTEDEALSWIEHVTLNQSAWQCLSNTSIGLCPTMDMMMRRYFHSWHRRKRQLSAVMMDKVDDLEESDEEGDAFTTWLPGMSLELSGDISSGKTVCVLEAVAQFLGNSINWEVDDKDGDAMAEPKVIVLDTECGITPRMLWSVMIGGGSTRVYSVY
uniref:Uncharacterized protein n=1 Tax=Corethron hystrix TaxID=216773 RepID=A0A7S1BVZ2_9STRA|mmetsp:Transcript_40808/g.95739  ORF Transcript_40808/g.95739 Transcript_40808/m.95739 type:complete len:207 (+) Transcript_40808:72-692(+)